MSEPLHVRPPPALFSHPVSESWPFLFVPLVSHVPESSALVTRKSFVQCHSCPALGPGRVEAAPTSLSAEAAVRARGVNAALAGGALEMAFAAHCARRAVPTPFLS